MSTNKTAQQAQGQHTPDLSQMNFSELYNRLSNEQKNHLFEYYGTDGKLDISGVAEAIKFNGLLDTVFQTYEMIIRYAMFELREAGQGSTADTILSVYDIVYHLQKARMTNNKTE